MKKFPPILALFIMALTIQAQSPQKFNYQGVARQASGQVIPDQAISIRASILDGSPSGLSQYVEQHTATTNQLGLFTASIGGGTVLTGSFANITWGGGDKYLKIEIDPAGGSNYSLTGVFQLLSVPYSLQSRNAEQIQGNPVSPTPPLDGQVLLWDENAGEWISADAAQSLVYTAGAGININASNVISNTAPDQTVTITGQGVTTVSGSYPNFTVNTPAPADNSPTNEIQILSLSGNTLNLSNGGGSVTLNNGTNYNAGAGIDISGNVISNTGDLSNTNEIQTLSLSGSNLSLTGGGSVILPDASATNEIQTISLTGSNLSLSNGGGSVTLPAEADGSVTNELQTLSLSGADLTLSNGGGTVTLPTGTTYTAGNGIDISGNVISNTGDDDDSATNEIQTLSIAGNTITLSNGGTVNLPAEVDGSVTNELQTLSLSGADLTLSNGGGTVTLPTGTTYTAGNGIDISGNVISNTGDDDDSATNEIQTLSIAGNTITLSNGGTVNLPAEVDGSVTNELQTLSLSGADLTLSNGGGTVTLPTGTTYTAGNGIDISGNVISNTGDDDDSPTNEIQTLSLSGDTLLLSNGGGLVILPEEVDGSVTNEIQSLSLNGDTLSLSNGGGSVLLPSGQIYTAGSGISIDGNNVISNTGDVVAADDINIGTTAGGDLSGVYPNPVVDGLQGKPVSPAIPSASQVLQWNGTAWAPATLPAAPAGWLLSGNSGTNPATHFIGTTDNQDLVFKRNNILAGMITFNNQAFGINALFSNTTGFSNTASGYYALRSNTTGSWNTATGYNALVNNTIGSYNTAAGRNVLSFNTTGSHNTATGNAAMHYNNTGENNTATGSGALVANTTGSDNTAAGNNALENNTTGFQNSAIGINTLTSNTTGSYNTAIGAYANVAAGNYTNANAIGNSATANASNKIRLGNTNITVIEGQVAYSWPSDARFKFNVEEEVIGLDFIKRLRPVNYQFDTRKFEEFLTRNMPDSIRRHHFEGVDFSTSTGIVHTGFIAQEVEQAARESGYAFDGVHAPTDGNDNYSMAYSQFVVPLVKAVQEQQEMIEQLEQKNAAQNDEIAQLKAELQEIRALLMARSN